MKRHRSRSGMALVMVLWILTVLSAVALEVSLRTRLRAQATHNATEATRAFYLAVGGVERAVADLKEARDGLVTLESLGETAERTYSNVELGEGSYTLLAGTGGRGAGDFSFGIVDESAKVNLNTADEATLGRLPGVTPDLAAGIVALRTQLKQIRELEDLLHLVEVDRLTLLGEDQNGNGILDPSENDGDETWPPDNRDGRLDPGLAAYLTCRSAARNVSTDGKKRVNINKADADEIVREVPQISKDQADSIVEQRKKGEFSSVVDLLDVMLVAKSQNESQGQGQSSGRGSQRSGSSGGAGGSGSSGSGGLSSGSSGRSSSTEGGGSSSESSDRSGSQPTSSQGSGGSQGGTGSSGGPSSGQSGTTTTTNQKAFDLAKFKEVADRLTTKDDEVLQGLVNLNTAPAEVVRCLPGLDENLAGLICARRDEAPFESVAALLDVQGIATDKLKGLVNLVSVRSDVFSVRSFGALGRQGEAQADVYRCVSVVIDRTGDTVNLLSWREPR